MAINTNIGRSCVQRGCVNKKKDQRIAILQQFADLYLVDWLNNRLNDVDGSLMLADILGSLSNWFRLYCLICLTILAYRSAD